MTTSHLSFLPRLHFDITRGKRSRQLGLRDGPHGDRATFLELVSSADELLQAYAPGALARLGLSQEGCIAVNLESVYGNENGPWAERKGFDSVVRSVVGINDAEGHRTAIPWRQLPIQTPVRGMHLESYRVRH